MKKEKRNKEDIQKLKIKKQKNMLYTDMIEVYSTDLKIFRTDWATWLRAQHVRTDCTFTEFLKCHLR